MTDTPARSKEFTRQMGKGRPAGSINRKTLLLRDAFLKAFVGLQEDEGKGDLGHFIQWAKDNPTEFYRLVSKLLPLQVTGDGGGPVQHQVAFGQLSEAALREIAALEVKDA